jgi:prepilin-type N-terminal cleavage/methylation domain-containing protein/prepilin-type processing-associated H-X9-DG protein
MTGAWLKHSHTPQGSASVGLDWALSSRSSQRIAFTLLELLVVIAVLSILAALLLPSLSAAKERAKEAVCRSNLRQMGCALTLYLDDFGVCPGRLRLPTIFPDLPDGKEPMVPGELVHQVCDQLADYLRVPASRIHQEGTAFHQRFVWNCPSVSAQNYPILFTGASDMRYAPDYAYNAAGTAWPSDPVDLGLSPRLIVPARSEAELPGKVIRSMRASEILCPSGLIALGDDHEKLIFIGGYATSYDQISASAACCEQGTRELGNRHRNGANVVFCDVHVEYRKTHQWLEASEGARSEWNVDHQPHRETWR